MKKRILNGLKLVAIYTVLTLVFVEILLWILGYRPYVNHDYKVHSTPENPYVADTELGIQLNEGAYFITLNNAVKFQATHQANGERKIPFASNQEGPEVVFYGCSYTYGYGVNDDESFPAIVQQEHPEWKVRNAAVVGYGTVQHLLQLKEKLKNDPPEAIILSLSSVHFIRTVLSQQYRANLSIGYRRSSNSIDGRMKKARFPFMTDCKKVQYATWESLYSEIPGRYWSATINFLQNQADRSAEPNCDPIAITACIIREMQEICAKNDVAFGVICLDTSHETVLLKKQLAGIAWKNIGFSFKQKKYTNLPHDSHPNKKGHQKIAASVNPFVERIMDTNE